MFVSGKLIAVTTILIAYGLFTSVAIFIYVTCTVKVKEKSNFIVRIKNLLLENKENETMNIFMFDDHNHDFSAENRVNVCEIFDFIKSVDITVNTLNSQLFCDDKANSSDLVCRWFFYQVDLPENNMCRRTSKDNVVPKIVYFVIFGTYTFRFWEYISVLSAKKFIKPTGIYVIGDAHPIGFWWERVLRDIKGIRFIYRKQPKIGKWHVKWNHHLSDVTRLQILLANGGIYMDTDMVIIQSLDPLLNYDITMGLVENATGMGNALILARRGSPFVRKWYKEYRFYKHTEFYRNSMQIPRMMWINNSKSIHLESDRFYRPKWFEADLLFNASDFPWRNNYAIHLWTYGNRIPKSPSDLENKNTTVVQLFKYVLYENSEDSSL